jgi:excisionase family DNA binding protein
MPAKVRFEPEVMTFAAAARTCGVNERTVRRWADDGRLPTVRMPSGRRALLEVDLVRAVERRLGRSAAARDEEG